MASLAAALPRPGRVLEVAAWALLVVMVALVATQIVGWTGHRLVAALQSLTPYVLGLAFPLAAAALVTRRWAMTGVATAVAIALVVMAWPLLRPPAQAAPAEGATPLRVFHANLLYRNTRYDDIAATVAGLDADVLAFTEYTREAAAALQETPLADDYPHRVEYPRGFAHGTAVWSRYPLTELDPAETRSESVLVRVDAPDPMLVYAVHVTSPLSSMDHWTAEHRRLETTELAELVERAGAEEPIVIVGDFNASFWHPRFRDLLNRGWTDAHQALGHGFSNSWPDDSQPFPNFVRLDHALLGERLVATDIDDVDVPGSDHVGFVVTVVRTAT